jgi:hypothetical protein
MADFPEPGPVERISAVDLFDDITTEPLRLGEEVRGPLAVEPHDIKQGDASTFSLDATTLDASSATTSSGT